MWRPVKTYALLWSSEKNKGFVKIILDDDSERKIKVNSPEELNVVGNLFRFERSVSYNLETGSLASTWISVERDDLVI